MEQYGHNLYSQNSIEFLMNHELIFDETSILEIQFGKIERQNTFNLAEKDKTFNKIQKFETFPKIHLFKMPNFK